MYTLITVGTILWFMYGLFKNDLPIILANGITLSFAITILTLKIKYK